MGRAGAPAWAKLHLWQMQPVRDVLLGLGVLAVFWLGQATSVVTVPLLLAILLAYLFEPVIQFAIGRLGMSRQGAVIGIIASLVLIVVVPVAGGITYGTVQAVGLTRSVLESYNRVQSARDEARPLVTAIDERRQRARAEEQGAVEDGAGDGVDESGEDAPSGDAPPSMPDPGEGADVEEETAEPDEDEQSLERIRDELAESTGPLWVWYFEQLIDEYRTERENPDVGEAVTAVNDFIAANTATIARTGAGFAVTTVERVLGFAVTAFGLAFMGFVTAFFFFFLATGWVEFRGFTDRLIPDKHRDRIVDLATKFDLAISGFVRGRITIAFIQSMVFSVGYFLIGVPASFILGPIVAILSIVPYLALVGVPVAIGLMYLAEPTGGFRDAWWWMLGAPTAFYFVAQALDDYVWTPMIQGKSTGLDTPVILFASIAGGALFGVFGLLIAIPLAACAKILIQEIFWPRFKEWAEGRADDPLPIEDA
ncbi:MAG: AI-2E family transporter [Phycisphaerales bacterium JB040]